MADGDRAIACNLEAIARGDRDRYHELAKRLRASIRRHGELPDGGAFLLDGSSMSLSEVAEWMGLERVCCPFLTFEVTVVGDNPDYWLKLTGPEGVKAVVEAEFRNPNLVNM